MIRLGFEPKTHSLEGCCSIQLSYRTDPYIFPFYRKVGAKVVKKIVIANGCFDLIQKYHLYDESRCIVIVKGSRESSVSQRRNRVLPEIWASMNVIVCPSSSSVRSWNTAV